MQDIEGKYNSAGIIFTMTASSIYTLIKLSNEGRFFVFNVFIPRSVTVLSEKVTTHLAPFSAQRSGCIGISSCFIKQGLLLLFQSWAPAAFQLRPKVVSMMFYSNILFSAHFPCLQLVEPLLHVQEADIPHLGH